MIRESIISIYYPGDSQDSAGRLQTGDIQAYLKEQKATQQAKGFTAMISWAKQRGFSGEVALALAADSADKSGIAAVCGLFPCDIISQWGTREGMRLLYPIFAHSDSQRIQLCLAARDYCQKLSEPPVGILTLCSNPSFMVQLSQEGMHFVEAWKYVVTIPFVIGEQSVWLFPTDENALQRHGGEVELPPGLRNLLDDV